MSTERIGIDGFCVLRGVVGSPDISILLDAVETAFSTYQPHAVNRWIRIADIEIPAVDRVMRRLMKLAPIGPLGTICRAHSYLKKMERSEYRTAKIGWHRDADAAGTATFGQCLNIWVPLDSVGLTTPSLELIPGSHRVMRDIPTDGDGAEIADDGEAFIDQHFPNAEVVTPRLSVGDVLIFDHHLMHRTQPMESAAPRRSVECRVTNAVTATIARVRRRISCTTRPR